MPVARAGFEKWIWDGTMDKRGAGAGALPVGNAGGQEKATPAGEKVGATPASANEKKRHKKCHYSRTDPFGFEFSGSGREASSFCLEICAGLASLNQVFKLIL